MKHIILIAGETSGGKDTFAKYLENLGLSSVCSYATRPMRPNEKDGREHHFISSDEASKILKEKKDQLIAYTKIGSIEYFALAEDVKNADMYIIDPNGIRYMTSHFPDIPVITVYITAPENIRKERAAIRGDLPQTLKKRMEDEAEQFSTFHEYDMRYDNIGSLTELMNFAKNVVQRIQDES